MGVIILKIQLVYFPDLMKWVLKVVVVIKEKDRGH